METVIAVCQMNVIAKRPDLNSAKMIAWLAEAVKCGANVAVFPEMAIPGYMVGDDWEDQAFIDDCASYAADVHNAAEELGIVAVFGTVTQLSKTWRHEDGRPLKFNSVELSVVDGGYRRRYDKTNLVNYREFDDKRHFANGEHSPAIADVGNIVISTTICEDGWDDDYLQKPIRTAAHRVHDNPRKSVHLNLSCSPFTLGKNAARDRRFAKHSELFHALIYVNNVGVQNNGKNVFVFDGSSTVYTDGKFMCSLPPLAEGIGYVAFMDDKPVMTYTYGEHGLEWVFDNPLSEQDKKNHRDPKKHEVLAYAIREFCAQSGIRRVVIGLSGGIDSALSAMLHVKALGKENVIAVNMPTVFNSDTTKEIAKKIAENLGVRYLVVPIGWTVDQFSSHTLTSLYDSGVSVGECWVDTENIQARMRGAGVQAMLAAGFGAVFPNNGNKAETTVGYCTLLGDHAGYLAPIADLWKHEIYEVSKELSDELGNVLPTEIFSLKPSAELSADHDVDQGKGDPIQYWYHDRLFASWIEPWCRLNIENSLAAYQESALKFLATLGLQDRLADFLKLFPTDEAFISDLERWWKLFKGMGIVKRVQAPPIVVISRRAFGFDFREAIGSVHFTRKYLAMKQQLLQGNTTTTEKQEN